MEQNNHKFRLRLNLFDAIVLVVVLAAGAAVAWFGLRSGGGETSSTSQTVQYTIMFQSMTEGSSELIQPGDPLAYAHQAVGNCLRILRHKPFHLRFLRSRYGKTQDQCIAQHPGSGK